MIETREKIAVVGCGEISDVYLKNFTSEFADSVDVVAVCDTSETAAREKASKYGIPRIIEYTELLSARDISTVVNLTPAFLHFSLNSRAIAAGKNVYTEKIMASSYDEAARLVITARNTGVKLGSAPDTIFGKGLHAARRIVESGTIGTVFGGEASIVMGSPMDSPHAGADGFYREAGEPFPNMGVYYLTALTHLLGPIRRIMGFTSTVTKTRTFTNRTNPNHGKTTRIGLPTAVAGSLEFASGAIVTISVTTESVGYYPRLVLYGTKGILDAGDPNTFDSPVTIRDAEGRRHSVTTDGGYKFDARGFGLIDLLKYPGRTGDPGSPAARALHVVEAIYGMYQSADRGRAFTMTTLS